MTVAHEKEVEAKVIDHPAVKNAVMRVLVGPSQGWSDYVMRVVELDLEGFSPKHTHPWPHINYFLEGRGVLEIEGRVHHSTQHQRS
jgi:quercetin dioxygenase-like cupin family protein